MRWRGSSAELVPHYERRDQLTLCRQAAGRRWLLPDLRVTLQRSAHTRLGRSSRSRKDKGQERETRLVFLGLSVLLSRSLALCDL